MMILKKIPFKIAILIVAGVVIFLPGFTKVQKLLSRNKELKVQVERLKRENKDLAEEIYRFKNDPVYLEKVAREEMKLGRDGEIIYRIVPEKK